MNTRSRNSARGMGIAFAGAIQVALCDIVPPSAKVVGPSDGPIIWTLKNVVSMYAFGFMLMLLGLCLIVYGINCDLYSRLESSHET